MFWVVVIILVIVVIAYNSSKKKKARQSGQPGGQAPNQAALRQGMEWLTHHPFTPQVLEFYAGLWSPEGKLYQASQQGEPPIASFVIHAGQDGTYETVYLKDGTSFDSNVSQFPSMGGNHPFLLDTPEKRAALERYLFDGLSKLPTLNGTQGRLTVVPGVSPGAAGKRPASKASATASAKTSGASKTGAPPKAGDKLDQDAFARAFAHMSGGGATPPKAPQAAQPEAPKHAPAKPEPPKSQPPKGSAPPKAGDAIDQDAFARAFAHMSGGGATPPKAPQAAQPEPPKHAPAKPEAPQPPQPEAPKPAASDDDSHKRFVTDILGYYHNLWNRENGSLYTELGNMPIRCFTIQVRADKLVESVWLEGDEIPLVSDTEFSKLSPENASVYPLAEPAQNQLFGLIRDYLLHLGTVELRGDSFYPLRPGQAPAGQGAASGASSSGTSSGGGSAPAGKGAQGAGKMDQDAQLRAQVQAMLERQKKDNPPKK